MENIKSRTAPLDNKKRTHIPAPTQGPRNPNELKELEEKRTRFTAMASYSIAHHPLKKRPYAVKVFLNILKPGGKKQSFWGSLKSLFL